MRPIRVVSPYRPFEPESQAHQLLGPFDWEAALQMLRVSVQRAMGCETYAITDVDTALPGQTFQYQTTERRLMLWILDVALCYLRSDDFDQDTVMLSPDLLVFGDLRKWMHEHFVVLMRAEYQKHPILNGVQFWPVRRKALLVDFYSNALEIGRTSLDEGHLRWGGDTEPIRRLLEPLKAGLVMRDGRPLAHLIESSEILQSFSSSQVVALGHGKAERPIRPVLDFRYLRKNHMRRYFEAAFGPLAVAA